MMLRCELLREATERTLEAELLELLRRRSDHHLADREPLRTTGLRRLSDVDLHRPPSFGAGRSICAPFSEIPWSMFATSSAPPWMIVCSRSFISFMISVIRRSE